MITRKLTLFLVCAVELTLILFMTTGAALAEPSKLSSKNLLTLFPICEIPSSLGQRCKYDFKDASTTDFIEVCCPNGHKVLVNEKYIDLSRCITQKYSNDL